MAEYVYFSRQEAEQLAHLAKKLGNVLPSVESINPESPTTKSSKMMPNIMPEGLYGTQNYNKKKESEQLGKFEKTINKFETPEFDEYGDESSHESMSREYQQRGLERIFSKYEIEPNDNLARDLIAWKLEDKWM